MKEYATLSNNNAMAVGHCQIEYKDPITGKVLEKIEGDNHVFTDQFYFQNRTQMDYLLSAPLVLTNGTDELDTDFPILPGAPVGFGYPGSAASGLLRGAYRSSDSYYYYRNYGIERNLVYDFLPTQIPDTIRYIGLTHEYGPQGSNEAVVQSPFTPYKSATSWINGIYDIERKIWIGNLTASNGSITFQIINSSGNTSTTTKQIYELLGNFEVGSYWTGELAYDNITQNIIIHFVTVGTRSNAENGNYSYPVQEGYWKINFEATEVLDSYFYNRPVINSNSNYYTSILNTITIRHSHYNAARDNIIYKHYITGIRKVDISTNTTTTKGFTVPNWCLLGTYSTATTAIAGYHMNYYPNLTFCYKNYYFYGGPMNRYYLSFNSSPTAPNTSFLGTNNIIIRPIYNIETEEIYSYSNAGLESFSQGSSSYTPIENSERNKLIIKDLYNAYPGWCSYPMGTTYPVPENRFAYTAYRLPLDAPTRPENSAVSITYNLKIYI